MCVMLTISDNNVQQRLGETLYIDHTYNFNVSAIYWYGDRSYGGEQPRRQNTYIIQSNMSWNFF